MRPDHVRTALLAGILVLSACGFLPNPTPDPIPTEDQAIAFLNELVALAQAGDLDGMCRHARDSNCDDLVEGAGGAVSIPSDPPILAGTRLIPGTSSGNSGTVGGMLLVLCGTDGRQRPYRTEMLVSRFRGEVYAINAVYWSGSKLAVSPDTGSPSGGAGIDCP
jgi:hypothetical protein